MRKDQCARKTALLEEVQAAMVALLGIHNEEVAALLAETLTRWRNSGPSFRRRGLTRPA